MKNIFSQGYVLSTAGDALTALDFSTKKSSLANKRVVMYWVPIDSTMDMDYQI